jgi:hypothetical protein
MGGSVRGDFSGSSERRRQARCIMAYIFKPKFLKLGIICGRDGRPMTETRTTKCGPRKGQRIEVVKREPDREGAGNVVMLESWKWAIEYTDAAGRHRKPTGYADRGPTLQRAATSDRGEPPKLQRHGSED